MSEKPKYYHDSVKKIKKNLVVIENEIVLPEGKTTTEGNYPKFRDEDNCAFPERASCNDGDFFCRCEFMECISMGNWKCTFKKENGEKKIKKTT